MPSTIFNLDYKTVASITDVGKKRDNNEDALLLLDKFGCYVISDGMGGGSAGEIASSTVVTYIRNAMTAAPMLPESRRERFSEAVYAAHKDILAYAGKKNYSSMGATLAAILLNPWESDKADFYHAGDSRIYRLRKKRLQCLTTDHTVGNASGLSENQMPPGMSGLLSNAVGISNGFFITDTQVDLCAGDIFLICSDGLYRQIPDDRIISDLSRISDLKQILNSWVALANEAGGIDNFSGILIRFNSIPDKYVPSEDEIRQDSIPNPHGNDVGDSDAATII